MEESMSNGRDNFALDWIKRELDETLKQARQALEAYAEERDRTRMRACLTHLHQVHGTLLMLELGGVTLLSDELEQLAQAMLAGQLEDEQAGLEALMQGIVQLPDYLEQIQRGLPDSRRIVLPLANEVRLAHGKEALPHPNAGKQSLFQIPNDTTVARFDRIEGVEKVRRIRAAYQQVLLAILRGEDKRGSIATLSKVAVGLERICDGTPMSALWRTFGEFVASLALTDEELGPDVVKLLRRVDAEMKVLIQQGAAALRRPPATELMQALMQTARQRGLRSPLLDDLEAAVAEQEPVDAPSTTGDDALRTAAGTLREELTGIKNQLDLYVRNEDRSQDSFRSMLAPLKQIGSTLGVLGFDRARNVLAAQVERLSAVEDGAGLDDALLSDVAEALLAVDQELASAGGHEGEAEMLAGEARAVVLEQARLGLDQVKQAVVDYVSSHWDQSRLADVPPNLVAVRGALQLAGLDHPARLIGRCARYVEAELFAGKQPDWQALDNFADAISGIDYYLERLSEQSRAAGNDILELVESSLRTLGYADVDPGPAELTPEAGTLPEQAADSEAASAPALEEPELDAPVSDAFESEGSEPAAAEPEPEPEPEMLEAELPPSAEVSAAADDEPLPTADLAADEEAAGKGDLMDSLVSDDLLGDLQQVPDDQEDATETSADTQALPEPLEAESLEELSIDEFTVDADDDTSDADNISLDQAGPELNELDMTDVSPPPASAPEPATADADLETGELDEDILEIFVEEVTEVLETLSEWLPRWAQALNDEEALTETRRAFHTLKGSGRIVGATTLAELAWSVENMLNRVMDGTLQANSDFPALVAEAVDAMPQLRDAFSARTSAPNEADVAQIMERADLLASGGSLDELSSGGRADEVIDLTLADAKAEGARSTSDDDKEMLPEIEFADSDRADDETMGLFEAEAADHLAALEASFLGDDALPGRRLDDDILRRFHTLRGSASVAGIAPVYRIASALNEVAVAVHDSDKVLDADLFDFFQQGVYALKRCTEALLRGAEPDEDVALFETEARRLVDAMGDEVRSMGALLSLGGADALLHAQQFLESWRDGEEDLARFSDLVAALHEVRNEAEAQNQDQVRILADILLTHYDVLENQALSAERAGLLIEAHEQLLVLFDAIAAAQSLPNVDPLLLDLEQALQPAPTPEPEAETPATETSPAREVAPESEPEAGTPVAPTTAGPSAPADTVSSTAAVALPELPEDTDPEILNIFVEEADELLENMDQSIHEWLAQPDNRIHIENLLRALHTLKGGARLAGLAEFGDETHAFESYLISVQDEDSFGTDLFDRVQMRHDELAHLLALIKAAAGLGPVPQARPQDAAPQAPAAPAQEAAADTRSTAGEAEPEVSDEEAAPAPARPPAQSQAPSPAQAQPEPQPERPAQPAASADDGAADDVSTRTPAEPRPVAEARELIRVSANLLEELVNVAGESSIIRSRVEQGISDFTTALDEMSMTIERMREQLRRLEIETEAQIQYRQEQIEVSDDAEFDPLEMDRYSQLQQLARALSESASDMLDLKETLRYRARESETLLIQQARLNTELQEGLMRTRMVPFGRMIPRLRRIVRQVAREVGKEVEFNAYNVEGELDRNVLERVVPALEHMLRNAVDHGIEKPDLRTAFAKPPMGRIDMHLAREGADVLIEITDDGRGIDVESVRAKAVSRGLMQAEDRLDDEAVLQFIFAPGFSTAEAVTQISGRGVGMDVVHTTVKQLGGSIDITSTPNKGTRFTVRLPFTVSVNRALMVAVADDLYAIPLNAIEGIVRVPAQDLEDIYAQEGGFEYAGAPYRLRYLGHYLGRDYVPRPDQTSVPVVLVRAGDQSVAIHVDGVHGSREIVVKSLGPQFAGVAGISGATILGDGSVVVILDLVGLVRSQTASISMSMAAPQADAERPPCVMVVDDSVTVRKVTSRVLERQGMDVLVAKDGVEAVAMLAEQKPDIILLDIEMPRMDGFEVARHIRNDERLQDLPIVMVSSRTGAKHQERAVELGVNRFLGKPFQEAELLSTIDALVHA